MTTAPSPSPARIGLIGAGWRAEYFSRIARELPDRFEIVRVLVRTERSATSVTRSWAVPATTDLAEFLRGTYDYVVVSTPVAAAPELIEALVGAGIPVLTETPPAADVAALVALWRAVGGGPVQVAEQYHLQPHHAARIAVAHSGLIGDITSTRVSVAHGYHGVSLVRRALGVGLEPVVVTARDVGDRMVASRGRDGWAATLDEVPNRRTIALLQFADAGQTGVFDFAEEQYWSPGRSRHLSIHGTRGEVDDDAVNYLAGPARPVHGRLGREATGVDGDLSGMHLERIVLGGEPYYENRFGGARLNDDELAVAEAMRRMAHFAATGVGFYGLAEASHDQHLALLIGEAASRGGEIVSERMPWA